LAVGDAQIHQLFGAWQWKIAQQHAVHYAEDSGIAADAERQRQDGDGGKARVAAQPAKTVAEIAEQRMQPIADALLTDFLFHLFDAAECDARGALRFLWRHAGAEVFVSQQGQVRLHFVVEIGVRAVKSEEIAQKILGFRDEWHDGGLLRRFQSLRDGQRDTIPAPGFGGELLLSGLGEAVVFRPAVIFGVSPERRDPAFFFHAVQAGKKRAGFDGESAASDLLNSAGDAEAVQFAGDEGFEDEHVEGALQQGGGFVGQAASPIDCL
jgi:hypothetical protein